MVGLVELAFDWFLQVHGILRLLLFSEIKRIMMNMLRTLLLYCYAPKAGNFGQLPLLNLRSKHTGVKRIGRISPNRPEDVTRIAFVSIDVMEIPIRSQMLLSEDLPHDA